MTPRVRVVQVDLATLTALAAGDLAAARACSPVALPDGFDQPDWRSTWAMRRDQVAVDPRHAAWVTGLLLDEDLQEVVGRAGFHEPPDADGVVEVGYAVDPAWRRRGYGRAALAWLVDRARREPSVRAVRACISPDNAASLATIRPFGFRHVGDEWDEEDGLEQVWLLDVGDVGDADGDPGGGTAQQA